MTLPAAGWFPDPQDTARMRWWDGLTWSVETRPAPTRVDAALATAPSGDQSGATPTRPVFSIDLDRAAAMVQSAATEGDHHWAAPPRRVCVLSWGSLVLAGVSAVVNPDGVIGLIAVLLAVIGIIRPIATGTWRVVARSVAISALVLGAATTLIAANGFLQLV